MSEPAWMRLGKIRVRPRRRALGLERQQQKQVGLQGVVTGMPCPILRWRGIEAEIDDSTSFAPGAHGTPTLALKSVSLAGAHRRNRPADVRAASRSIVSALRFGAWRTGANQPEDSHDAEQRRALTLAIDHATEDVGEGGANRENHHHLNQVREETYRRTTSPGAFKQLRGSLLRLCEAICEFCSFCAR